MEEKQDELFSKTEEAKRTIPNYNYGECITGSILYHITPIFRFLFLGIFQSGNLSQFIIQKPL